MAASFGVSVALGRTLGASGLGIVNLALQTVSLLLLVTMFGMDSVLIKRIAIGYEEGDDQEIANSTRTSYLINGFIATVVTIVGILLAPWLSVAIFHTPALEIPLIISFAVIVPQTFSRIFAASLIGFRKIWQSNLVDNTLSVWIVGLGMVFLYCFRLPITVVSVAIIYAIGRLVVSSAMGIYWKTLFRFGGPRKLIPRPMLTMAMPLLIASGAYMITANADGVMLGWLKTPREVGLYSVAAKVAMLESFFLLLSNSTISPKLASLYAKGKIMELERMVRIVTGGLFVIATASLILFAVYGRALLSIWGHDFAGAYWVLIVLGVGQFFNISTGCTGMMLTMCGHEKTVGYLSASFLLLNLFLNYFLILAWGALGAAIATAITVAGENTIKVILTKRKIDVLTIPFFPSGRTA